jgi:hypothetical protein
VGRGRWSLGGRLTRLGRNRHICRSNMAVAVVAVPSALWGGSGSCCR